MKYNSVVILGPTAVGKTSLGVNLALKYGGEIISADSRQTYKGLDLGSGKDLQDYDVKTSEGFKHIPYHLIDVATLNEEYNVFCYQQDFYKAFADVTSRNVLPVIVGGTGMYVDSIIRAYELIDVPENPALRDDLEKLSLEELDEKLLSLKPDLHNRSDLNIRERVVRAIEIALFMKSEEGENLRKTLTARPGVRPLVVGTSIDRASLRKNIRIRLEQRFHDGMLEEVRNLHEKSGFSYERLEKLGLEYRFISEYLEGKISSYEEMFEKLYIAIGQFAKRQETWFRGMEKKGVKINWLPAVEDFNVRFEALCELIKKEANDFRD